MPKIPKRPSGRTPHRPTLTPEAKNIVQDIRRTLAALERFDVVLYDQVDKLRAAGASWDQVGLVLGMTGEGARTRFSRRRPAPVVLDAQLVDEALAPEPARPDSPGPGEFVEVVIPAAARARSGSSGSARRAGGARRSGSKS